MNVKFLSVALSLSLISITLTAISAQAQDKGLSPNEVLDPNHTESILNEDKTSAEHEAKTKLAARDSIMIHSDASPAHSKPADHKTPGSKEEDDALSFNFLYYIIQKFKISDLIDE